MISTAVVNYVLHVYTNNTVADIGHWA